MPKLHYRDIATKLDAQFTVINDPQFQLHTEGGCQVMSAAADKPFGELGYTLTTSISDPTERIGIWYDYFSRFERDELEDPNSPLVRYLQSLAMFSNNPRLLPRESAGMIPEMMGAGAGMAYHEQALGITSPLRRLVLASQMPRLQATFYYSIATSRIESVRQFRELLGELDQSEGNGGLLTPLFFLGIVRRMEITAEHIQAVASGDPKNQMHFSNILIEYWFSAIKDGTKIGDTISAFDHLCDEAKKKIATFLQGQKGIVEAHNEARAFVARILKPKLSKVV